MSNVLSVWMVEAAALGSGMMSSAGRDRTITRFGGTAIITPEARQNNLKIRQEAANDHAAKVKPTIERARRNGATLQAIADELNNMGLTTPRGAKWTSIAVSRAVNRAV